MQGIRLIKYYAWEAFYVQQIANLRGRELKAVRGLAYVQNPINTFGLLTLYKVCAGKSDCGRDNCTGVGIRPVFRE